MTTSNNLPEEIPTENRLHGGILVALHLIKFFGLFGSAVWGMALSSFDGGLAFLVFITSAIAIFISIQSVIAIIELLSEIEFNTRQH